MAGAAKVPKTFATRFRRQCRRCSPHQEENKQNEKTASFTDVTGASVRSAKLAAGSLALALGFFGTLTAVTALPAFAASVTSSNFTIGSPTGGVNAVTATPTSTVQSTASVSYTVNFTATAALASGGSITVTPSAALGSAPTNGSLVDRRRRVPAVRVQRWQQQRRRA